MPPPLSACFTPKSPRPAAFHSASRPSPSFPGSPSPHPRRVGGIQGSGEPEQALHGCWRDVSGHQSGDRSRRRILLNFIERVGPDNRAQGPSIEPFSSSLHRPAAGRRGGVRRGDNRRLRTRVRGERPGIRFHSLRPRREKRTQRGGENETGSAMEEAGADVSPDTSTSKTRRSARPTNC